MLEVLGEGQVKTSSSRVGLGLGGGGAKVQCSCPCANTHTSVSEPGPTHAQGCLHPRENPLKAHCASHSSLSKFRQHLLVEYLPTVYLEASCSVWLREREVYNKE